MHKERVAGPRDKYSDDNSQCHPVMKEAGKGGWGSGVRKGCRISHLN